MNKIVALLCLSLAALLPSQSWAKYPEKPVKLIVPFPAGGSTDALARLVAQSLSRTLGQQVVVENKAGAATILGVDAVAKAPADGYTILFGIATSFTINPHVYKKLPYNVEEFLPIGFICETPIVFVTSPAVPARNLEELIAQLKSGKDEVAVATTGKGGFSHLTAAMFFSAIGVKFRDVPYRGEAPAIQDLLGSQVSYYFGNLPGVMPQVSAGKLRAYAITSVGRAPIAPAIPSFTELGLKDVVANAWFGLMAPKGTPKDVVAAIADALNRTLDEKDVQARLAAEGAVSRKMKPEEFADYIRRDSERWGQIVRASRIEAE